MSDHLVKKIERDSDLLTKYAKSANSNYSMLIKIVTHPAINLEGFLSVLKNKNTNALVLIKLLSTDYFFRQIKDANDLSLMYKVFEHDSFGKEILFNFFKTSCHGEATINLLLENRNTSLKLLELIFEYRAEQYYETLKEVGSIGIRKNFQLFLTKLLMHDNLDNKLILKILGAGVYFFVANLLQRALLHKNLDEVGLFMIVNHIGIKRLFQTNYNFIFINSELNANKKSFWLSVIIGHDCVSSRILDKVLTFCDETDVSVVASILQHENATAEIRKKCWDLLQEDTDYEEIDSILLAIKNQSIEEVINLLKRDETHFDILDDLKQAVVEVETSSNIKKLMTLYFEFFEKINIPNEFLCPINRTIMFSPYITADTYTYEGTEIIKWIKLSSKNNPNNPWRSPKTNKEFKNRWLIINSNLKMLINDWLDTQHKNFLIEISKWEQELAKETQLKEEFELKVEMSHCLVAFSNLTKASLLKPKRTFKIFKGLSSYINLEQEKLELHTRSMELCRT